MATAGINPAYLVDPSLYGDQQAIEQQRQLAQLLMTQGLTPQGNSEVIGGVAIRRSPMEGAAKLAQLLSGQGIQRDSNLASQDLMQRQAQAMGSMFGMGQGQPQQAPQGAGPALGAALGGQGGQAALATPAGALGLPGMSPMQSLMSYSMNPDKYMESYLKGFTPNDTTIQARQGGVDPQMANRLALIKASTDPKILSMQQAGFGPMEIYKAIFGEAAKAAELGRRPGEGYANLLTGEAGMIPKVAENANIIGTPGPNGAIQGVTPIPGSAGVIASNAAADELAKQQNKVFTGVPGPNGVQSGFGSDLFTPGAAPNGAPPKFTIGDPAQARQQIAASGDKALLAQFDQQYPQGSGRVIQGPALGAETTANASAKDAVANWNDRHTFATVSAPRNISLLDSISQLADKTLVGPGSSQVQFVNGVLNTLGIKPGADQAQNYQIMSKNLNMLVGSQRMASSGGGSDALQTLLQAANPNNKEMNAPALKEAAQELLAYNRMQLALDRALPNPAVSGPQAAQTAETQMAPLSDPRIWQLDSAASDEERSRILSLMPPDQQREILKKAVEARRLGLLGK